jgi:hypothetical protein
VNIDLPKRGDRNSRAIFCSLTRKDYRGHQQRNTRKPIHRNQAQYRFSLDVHCYCNPLLAGRQAMDFLDTNCRWMVREFCSQAAYQKPQVESENDSIHRVAVGGCSQVRNRSPQLRWNGLLFAMRTISDCLLILVTVQMQHPLLVVACFCAAVELAFQYAVRRRQESESLV